jgi:hypothetical protein
MKRGESGWVKKGGEEEKKKQERCHSMSVKEMQHNACMKS